MKLKEYMKVLNRVIAEDSTLLDLEVVAASDDEGNSFIPVVFTPSAIRVHEREIIDGDPNCVCLN